MFDEGSVRRATALGWKLRRIAAGLRQQDVAAQAGMSTTRYSAIERGELHASDSDITHLERALPPLSPALFEGRQESAQGVPQAPASR